MKIFVMIFADVLKSSVNLNFVLSARHETKVISYIFGFGYSSRYCVGVRSLSKSKANFLIFSDSFEKFKLVILRYSYIRIMVKTTTFSLA